MIEHLTGAILHKEGEHVVIDAGGVGYGLDLSDRDAASLGPVGAQATLWVFTHVTETELSLFGFMHRAEREVFEVMLEISGVGPRLALAILSTFTVEQLIQITLTADAQMLKSVPGIGIKKAEKLILELKSRAKRLSIGIGPDRLIDLSARTNATSNANAAPLRPLPTPAARDAAAALEALDVPASTALRAVTRALEVLGNDAPAEDLVREGLRHRHTA